MFLTRFEVNAARRGAKKLLGSPQAMHAAVLAGFPRSPTGAERVLWRQDLVPSGAYLYLVSPRRPDLTHLAEQAGWPTTAAWDTRPYDGLLGALRAGQEWRFRLTANPTKSTKVHADRRSQRVGHVTVAQQLEWLLDRAQRWGFQPAQASASDETPAVTVVGRELLSFARRDPTASGRTNPVTITRATFEGQLVVTDAERLRTTLTSGAGPAKAYGCGLLTLAPVGR